MDYAAFYRKLLRPVEEELGPIDRDTLTAVVGFDAGGPLSLCTAGRRKRKHVTYVSCELAVRAEQLPSRLVGRYELMMTCDDENWAWSVLSDLGRMSLDARFEPGHTIDIGPWVKRSCPIQGLILEEFCRMTIDRRRVGILRAVGVSRPELKAAVTNGAEHVLSRLKSKRAYPRTRTKPRPR